MALKQLRIRSVASAEQRPAKLYGGPNAVSRALLHDEALNTELCGGAVLSAKEALSGAGVAWIAAERGRQRRALIAALIADEGDAAVLPRITPSAVREKDEVRGRSQAAHALVAVASPRGCAYTLRRACVRLFAGWLAAAPPRRFEQRLGGRGQGVARSASRGREGEEQRALRLAHCP